jgi:hypothetical protein
MGNRGGARLDIWIERFTGIVETTISPRLLFSIGTAASILAFILLSVVVRLPVGLAAFIAVMAGVLSAMAVSIGATLPLVLPMTLFLVIFVPIMLAASLRHRLRRRFSKSYVEHAFVWSRQRGWGPFIENNVLPGLPPDTHAYEMRKWSPGIPIASTARPPKRPYVVRIEWNRGISTTAFQSVNDELAAIRADGSKRSTSCQRRVQILLRNACTKFSA